MIFDRLRLQTAMYLYPGKIFGYGSKVFVWCWFWDRFKDGHQRRPKMVCQKFFHNLGQPSHNLTALRPTTINQLIEKQQQMTQQALHKPIGRFYQGFLKYTFFDTCSDCLCQ